MVDAGSVFGSLAGLPHFPMSFISISADFGLSIVTGEFFVQLNRQFEVYWCSRAEYLSQIVLFRTAYEAPSR